MTSRSRRFSISCLLPLLLIGAAAAFAQTASASFGALKIVSIEAQCDPSVPASTLASQLLAEPGVASVDFINGSLSDGGPGTTPTAQDLAGYDAAIVSSDCSFANPAGLGDAIADFQDAGGVVIAAGPWAVSFNYYDDASILGRWYSGGYFPAETTDDDIWKDWDVAPVDPSGPLFTGVGAITGWYSQLMTVSPGASVHASYDEGQPFLVTKGRAAVVNELLGDYNAKRSGNYGRLILNVIGQLLPRSLNITRSGNGAGTVTGSAGGILCGTVCALKDTPGTPVTLSASAAAGSQFIGWSGLCGGRANCQTAIGIADSSVDAQFALTKITVGKLKKRKISVRLPGAGKLKVSASGIGTISKKTSAAKTLKLTLKPTKKMRAKLRRSRKAKLKLKLVYTPLGGTGVTTKKTVTMK